MDADRSLSDDATFAGAAKRRAASEVSLGDERTLGDNRSGRDTVIDDIEAVVALLADRLGVEPSSIAVGSGHGSPAKVVDVDGRDAAAIRQAFSSDCRVRTVKSSGCVKQE
jgi:hypothetical protein